jgi:F-type H+-transporting ATPase subunit alpha
MLGWQEALLRDVEASHADILKDIAEKKEVTPETEGKLREAIETFNRSWQV